MQHKDHNVPSVTRGMFSRIRAPRYSQYYVLIFCVTLFCSWFVQLGYYLIMIRLNPEVFSGQRVLTDYTTGFIGDVVLVPLMNVVILYAILHTKVRLHRRDIVAVILAGLAADYLLHFFQAYLKLTNWSMPRPFAWSFVGYWHMVYFFFQISFVWLFFYLMAMGAWRRNVAVKRAAAAMLLLIAIFISLFLYDYIPAHRPAAGAPVIFSRHQSSIGY